MKMASWLAGYCLEARTSGSLVAWLVPDKPVGHLLASTLVQFAG
jgi:hypothetical protein